MRSYTIPAAKPMAAPRSGPAAMPPPMATSSIRSACTPKSARFDEHPELEREGGDQHERRAHRDGERTGRDHVGGSHRSTVTNCIRSVSAMGRTTSSSVSPPPASRTVRTFPTGIESGNALSCRAARGERGAGLRRVVDLRLEARVDEEVLTLALAVGGAGRQIAAEEPDPHQEVGVGDELHRRSARVTCTIRPTSPAPFTTGMPTLRPSSLPLLMSMVCEKFDGSLDSTRAVVVVDVADPLEVLLLEDLGELAGGVLLEDLAALEPPRAARRSSSFSVLMSP